MALTLADYAASPKPLVAGVAKILREESPFMDSLPIESVGALAVQVIRQGTLPTVAWRKAGAAHGTNKGTKPTPVTETAFSFGNQVDVDKVYVMDKGPKLYDPRVYWTDQTTIAMGREFNDAAINGNPNVNPDRPTGLFHRIINDHAAQNITADPAGGVAGLDISPDAVGLAANIATFFDRLDLLLYSLAGHTADLILTNDSMLMRYWSIARQSGLLKTTTDNLGREFYEYKGAKIIDMGFQVNDTTRIVGNADTLAGTALTGGTATSLYAVKLGAEYFTGWEEYPMDVEDLGRLDDGVTWRTLIDWVVGFAISHPRSVARLFGVVAV